MSLELRYGSNADKPVDPDKPADHDNPIKPEAELCFKAGEENDAIVQFAKAVVRLEADKKKEFAYVSLTRGGYDVLTWTQTGNELAKAVGEPLDPRKPAD